MTITIMTRVYASAKILELFEGREMPAAQSYSYRLCKKKLADWVNHTLQQVARERMHKDEQRC